MKFIPIIEAVSQGFNISKSEAKRLVKQNAIKVMVDENEFIVINDIDILVDITKEGFVIKKGKRNFIRIALK